MTAKTVLFLDFDGVLNDEAWIQSNERIALGRASDGLDYYAHRLVRAKADIRPEYAAKVKALVEEIGCEVIVCSNWRSVFSDDELREILSHHGLPFHGATRRPRMSEYRDIRLSAILGTAHDFPAGTRWCVLDDQVDPTLVDGRGVCPDDGATDEDIAKAREILLNWTPPPAIPVHLVEHADQGDLKIKCTGLWTGASWKQPEDTLPDGVHLADPYEGTTDQIRYTFHSDKTTCPTCKATR